MGKNYAESGEATEKDFKVGPFDVIFSAKVQYGLNLPSEQLESQGVAADLFGGMFWPIAVDCEQYNMGAVLEVKTAMQVKIDVAGDINWGIIGFDFSATGTGVEAQLGFETDSWGAWSYEKAAGIAGWVSAKMSATALNNRQQVSDTASQRQASLRASLSGADQNVSSNTKTPVSINL